METVAWCYPTLMVDPFDQHPEPVYVRAACYAEAIMVAQEQCNQEESLFDGYYPIVIDSPRFPGQTTTSCPFCGRTDCLGDCD